MNKIPPAGFVLSLKSFDKDLRVRWSQEHRKWVIEGKAKDQRGLVRPIKYSKDINGKVVETIMDDSYDLKIGWRDGYYQVLYADKLTSAIFYRLSAGDTTKLKRIDESWRRLEAHEAAVHARREKKVQDDLYAHSGEVYDYMANRGSRAFPGGTSL